MSEVSFTAARDFVLLEGRLLERRMFATLFQDAPATGVIEALRGYRNEDGGFGHGLEADKLCPASLPIDVELALQAMATVGHADPDLVGGGCDFLASVAAPDGAVPLAFPVIEAHPRAEHWTEWTYAPGLNPTAGLVGLLRKLGCDHPWVERASGFCWRALDTEIPAEAHTLREVLVFLEHAPERERAEALAPLVVARLGDAQWYQSDAYAEGYGLSVLEYAPRPDSRWRPLFDDT